MILYVASLVVAAAISVLGFSIPSSQYSAILSVMVGVSGAVFTIMGIWIAHLYPNIITALKEPRVIAADFSPGKKDGQKLTAIIGVITTSSINMALSVILVVVVAVCDGIGDADKKIVMTAVQVFTLVISFTQVFSVISVVHVCSGFIRAIRAAGTSIGHDLDS